MGTLPANVVAQSELGALTQAAAGETRPVPLLPQVAQDISGLTYKLNKNSLGWQEIGVLFEPGSAEAFLRLSNSPDLLIGLDNRYRLTESLASRPVGLRGDWQEDGKFFIEYILFGDFIHSQAWFEFDDNRITNRSSRSRKDCTLKRDRPAGTERSRVWCMYTCRSRQSVKPRSFTSVFQQIESRLF